MRFIFKAVRNILFLIAEQETTGKNAAFHAGIAGTILDPSAMSVFFMGATPAIMTHSVSRRMQYTCYNTTHMEALQ
ncbi:MAG: hypothetical protein BMS9Abin18_0142 [Zetaproteobacteria bacterium]|nr:MAG: hypothetical protein BMS9Abin18_0142 [Zetaproteobacteria bacterium]